MRTALLALLAALASHAAAAAATLTVCATGCDHAEPLAAWVEAAARVQHPGESVLIKISDGTYPVHDQFFTDCPCTERIQVIGNPGAPEKVVLDFVNINGTNFSGFAASNGGRIGLVDGVLIRGNGARTGRTEWRRDSYGAAVLAQGSGSSVSLGPHVIVDSFYYGILADQGGHVTGDGSTFRNAGDANLLARFGGVIQCRGCSARTAAHIFDNGAETLGYNALAEGGSLYVDGSNFGDAQVACVAAQSNGLAWAHRVTATGCLGSGARASQNGFLELNNAHLSRSTVGVYATTGGGLNLDAAEMDHNAREGVLLDGGHAAGSRVSVHDNGASGIKVMKQGRGEFYKTSPLLTGNAGGAVHIERATGCTAANGPCSPASTLILD